MKTTRFWHFYYNTRYYITHPWKWVKDFYCSLNYAFQRAIRGWDDTVSSDIESYLSISIPIWLKVLRKNKCCVPLECFDEHTDVANISAEAEQRAHIVWENAVDKMIAGFDAANCLENMKYETHDDAKKLFAQFHEGFELFHKYYFSLWD